MDRPLAAQTKDPFGDRLALHYINHTRKFVRPFHITDWIAILRHQMLSLPSLPRLTSNRGSPTQGRYYRAINLSMDSSLCWFVVHVPRHPIRTKAREQSLWQLLTHHLKWILILLQPLVRGHKEDKICRKPMLPFARIPLEILMKSITYPSECTLLKIANSVPITFPVSGILINLLRVHWNLCSKFLHRFEII